MLQSSYIPSLFPNILRFCTTCSLLTAGFNPKRVIVFPKFCLYGGTSTGGKKYASSFPGPCAFPFLISPECTWQGIGGTSSANEKLVRTGSQPISRIFVNGQCWVYSPSSSSCAISTASLNNSFSSFPSESMNI